MGKATTRRKERRRKFLARLAQVDPERFEREWAKRIESWAVEINRLARDKKGKLHVPIQVPRVFSVADKAKETLLGCGEKAVELELKETKDVLENECCQALAPSIGREIYRINQKWKPKE